MIRILGVSVITIFCFASAIAQDPNVFIDESWRVQKLISSDYSLAVADLNGDYRDDIVRMNSDSIHFSLNTTNEGFLVDFSTIAKPFDVLSTNIIDINNDHINELVISGNKTGLQIYHLKGGTLEFESGAFTDHNLYTQGSSVVDINSDGWLDLFVTNDIGYNRVFMNNENQSLDTSSIDDFDVLAPSGSSGNYNSTWADVDGDGDLDLYIAKCHINATSFTDPRRINQYFENRNGSFVEMGASLNLDQGDQSWCSAAGDLDNDGDVDFVLINHGTPIMILENNYPNGFVEHASFTDFGEIIGDEQQVILQDFNNDGWLDILILGFNDRLLLNRGNLNFFINNNPLGPNNAYSGACGDFNNDGWMDIYAVYGTADSGVDDKLWSNFPISNHYVKISLSGNLSNAQAVGAQVIAYGPWGSQHRWLTSGDSYGITSTMNLHFGLDENTVIDSLVCRWPSGVVDRYELVEADRHYVLSEGECLQELDVYNEDSIFYDCESETYLLMQDHLINPIWNMNDTVEIFSAEPESFYYVMDGSECRNASQIFYLENWPDVDEDIQLYAGDSISICEGDLLYLTSNKEFEWNIPQSIGSRSLEVNESGSYYCFSTNICDTIYSDTVHVFFNAFELDSISISIDSTEEHILQASDENTIWYNSEFERIGQGSEWLVADIFRDTTFYFQQVKERSFSPYTAGLAYDSNLFTEHSEDFNLSTRIVVLDTVLIHSINVFAIEEGLRQLIVLNVIGDTIFSMEKYLTPGANRIETNIALPASAFYYILFNQELSISEFGNVSPQLQVIQLDEESYPLEVGDKIIISSDNFSDGNRQYFFDWEISPQYEVCLSELYPYHIDVDTIVSTLEPELEFLKVYPNPAVDQVFLDWQHEPCVLKVYDMYGKMVFQTDITRGKNVIDLNDLDNGLLLLELRSEEANYIQRIIKLR